MTFTADGYLASTGSDGRRISRSSHILSRPFVSALLVYLCFKKLLRLTPFAHIQKSDMDLGSSSDAREGTSILNNEDEVAVVSSVVQEENVLKADELAEPEDMKLGLAKCSLAKQELSANVVEKKKHGPLQLLDLPMDMLKDIIKEVGPVFESLTSVSELMIL